jgi:hypothetical protein
MDSEPESQIESLKLALWQSPVIPAVLDRAGSLGLPEWYLGAGCISQTVWNHISGQELTSCIDDLDLVYFDPNDVTYEGENQRVAEAQVLFNDLPIRVDVKNQARVHLWYEQHFGYRIEPYGSVEDAIRSWPTTATCVGVRYEHGDLTVYAPHGLNDLMGMVVRPNKVQVTEEVYVGKAERWKQCWPDLEIKPW